MGGTNDFATEGPSRGLTSPGVIEGPHRLRPFTRGAPVGAALLGWLLALVVGAGSLLAGEKGRVTGTVAGPSNVPVPGAKVTLAAADGGRQSVTADQTGNYLFPSVEPGSYTITAGAAGYQAVTRADVRVAGGAPTTVDLLIAAASPAGPNQNPPAAPPPSYHDDTQLKASAVKSTIDAAGYSSQAQSPRRLLSEGPSLSGNVAKAPARQPGSPEAAAKERELREALRADPNGFDANHQMAEYYLSVGDSKAAIPNLEKAQELKPGHYANGHDLAVAYLETKSPAKAQPLLRELIGRQDAAELHNLLGQAEEALDDPTSAAQEFQRAAQMDPSEKNLFDWGNELLFHESVEPALEVFQRGVALYPNSSRMYIGLGIAFYSRGSYDAAIEALCHASDFDPADARPYVFLGKMYNVSVSHADEVATRLKRFRETNPDNPLAYYYAALSAWKGPRSGNQGVDLAQVEALLRKAIALDPQLADAHLQLGTLYHDQQREPEAVPEFQAAVRLNPANPDAHYRLAQAYLRTGDKQRGQEELQLYDKLRQPPREETDKRRREAKPFGVPQNEPGKTPP
ncbi:MAG: tetratricopeptide repeat protein [Acidobacteriia bacterium]|nr:tetratricopeptide repeat protein [Terriglobia bacterium]